MDNLLVVLVLCAIGFFIFKARNSINDTKTVDKDKDSLPSETKELPRAVEPLIKALADNDRVVRSAAARALGELRDPRAVEPLIKMLTDESDVRGAAVEALSKLGEPKWQELIKGNFNDLIRLGESKDPRAFEPLMTALGFDDPSYRDFAAKALGELRDPRAVEPLIKMLTDESDVRGAAARALGELGDRRAVEPLIKVITADYLALIIDIARASGSKTVKEEKSIRENFLRRDAMTALGKLWDPRAVEPIIKVLADNNEGVVRQAFGQSLSGGYAGLIGPIGPLREAAVLRRFAVRALGELGDPRAVEPLIKVLGDGDSDVREAAKEALGKLSMMKCHNCGFVQRSGDWEKAMDAKAKTLGNTGFYNINRKPECLKCGSLNLFDVNSTTETKSGVSEILDNPERLALIVLCKKYVEIQRNLAGDKSVSDNMKKIKNEIAIIGQRIGDKGGFSLMRQIGESLDQPQWRSVVESSWDGIHGWMC